MWEKVRPDLLAHEAAYGAPVFSRKWKSYSRGKTLAFYFANIGPQIEGRRILHVAPEAELAAWFTAQVRTLGARYETVNLGSDVHFVEDLTALDLPDASFDWVICHRVLEHIFDDGAAIGEALRILRRGGVFNVSVPESMQVAQTDMWAIPDLSHHHHYRRLCSQARRGRVRSRGRRLAARPDGGTDRGGGRLSVAHVQRAQRLNVG